MVSSEALVESADATTLSAAGFTPRRSKSSSSIHDGSGGVPPPRVRASTSSATENVRSATPGFVEGSPRTRASTLGAKPSLKDVVLDITAASKPLVPVSFSNFRLHDSQYSDLKMRLSPTCKVFYPDEEFDHFGRSKSTAYFASELEKVASVIVRPVTVGDVKAAVSFAKENSLICRSCNGPANPPVSVAGENILCLNLIELNPSQKAVAVWFLPSQ